MENSIIKVTFRIDLVHNSYNIIFKSQMSKTNNAKNTYNDHKYTYQLIIKNSLFLSNDNKAINFQNCLYTYNVKIRKIY